MSVSGFVFVRFVSKNVFLLILLKGTPGKLDFDYIVVAFHVCLDLLKMYGPAVIFCHGMFPSCCFA